MFNIAKCKIATVKYIKYRKFYNKKYVQVNSNLIWCLPTAFL